MTVACPGAQALVHGTKGMNECVLCLFGGVLVTPKLPYATIQCCCSRLVPFVHVPPLRDLPASRLASRPEPSFSSADWRGSSGSGSPPMGGGGRRGVTQGHAREAVRPAQPPVAHVPVPRYTLPRGVRRLRTGEGGADWGYHHRWRGPGAFRKGRPALRTTDPARARPGTAFAEDTVCHSSTALSGEQRRGRPRARAASTPLRLPLHRRVPNDGAAEAGALPAPGRPPISLGSRQFLSGFRTIPPQPLQTAVPLAERRREEAPAEPVRPLEAPRALLRRRQGDQHRGVQPVAGHVPLLDVPPARDVDRRDGDRRRLDRGDDGREGLAHRAAGEAEAEYRVDDHAELVER
eukprot:gene9693-biopygen10201